MWVPPDPQAHAVGHPDLPPEVLAIQRYARALGCCCSTPTRSAICPPGTGNRQTPATHPFDPSGDRAGRVPQPPGTPRGGYAARRGVPVNSRGRTTVHDTSSLMFDPAAVQAWLRQPSDTHAEL